MSGKGNNEDTKIGMYESDFNREFFSKTLEAICLRAELISWQRVSLSDKDSSILSGLDNPERSDERILGIVGYRLQYKDPNGTEESVDVAVKVKPNSRMLWEGINGLIQNLGGNIAKIYSTKYVDSELHNTREKDFVCMLTDNPVIASLRPKVYHVLNNPEKDHFACVMENLKSDAFTHVDSVVDVTSWAYKDIHDVLDSMARYHGQFYGNIDAIPEQIYSVLDPRQTVEFHKRMVDLWSCFTEHAHTNFPDMFDKAAYNIMQHSFKNVDDVCKVLDASPITVIHNDFNARNLCLRRNPTGNEHLTCLYDWELIRYGLPQHDLAEFLVFILPQNSTVSDWESYIEYYRQALQRHVQVHDDQVNSALEKDTFSAAFDMSLIALFWNRITSYFVVHYFAKLPFMDRVIKNGLTILKHIASKYECLK